MGVNHLADSANKLPACRFAVSAAWKAAGRVRLVTGESVRLADWKPKLERVYDSRVIFG
jgi:hypothetical protein